MNIVFYVAGAVAIFSTAIAITRPNAIHALLWVMLSLIAAGLVFYTLGAPYVAILEIIIYAGAIVVLFVFVVMMLNLSEAAVLREREWVKPSLWIWPSVLAAVLIGEVIYLLSASPPSYGARAVDPKQVGFALFSTYIIGVELISTLLLGGLVAAYHIGWRTRERGETRDVIRSHGTRVSPGGDPVRAGRGRLAGAP